MTVATTITGITAKTTSDIRQFTTISAPAMPKKVRIETTAVDTPFCRKLESASMSEVIRVISRPAISFS